MIITCPNCLTEFRLNPMLYNPGRRLKCSVCSFEFVLPKKGTSQYAEMIKDEESSFATIEESSPPTDQYTEYVEEQKAQEDFQNDAKAQENALYEAKANRKSATSTYQQAQPQKKSAAKKFLNLLLLFIVLGGIGYGGFYLYDSFYKDGQDLAYLEVDNFEQVKDLQVKVFNQQLIKNDILGNILVVEGSVLNNSKEAKSRIKIEASIYDTRGNLLGEPQPQYCGVVPMPLQYKVLNREQLVSVLTDRYQILANNTNIQPGAEVPFAVVFIYPPKKRKNFSVRVLEADTGLLNENPN